MRQFGTSNYSACQWGCKWRYHIEVRYVYTIRHGRFASTSSIIYLPFRFASTENYTISGCARTWSKSLQAGVANVSTCIWTSSQRYMWKFDLSKFDLSKFANIQYVHVSCVVDQLNSWTEDCPMHGPCYYYLYLSCVWTTNTKQNHVCQCFKEVLWTIKPMWTHGICCNAVRQ